MVRQIQELLVGNSHLPVSILISFPIFDNIQETDDAENDEDNSWADHHDDLDFLVGVVLAGVSCDCHSGV